MKLKATVAGRRYFDSTPVTATDPGNYGTYGITLPNIQIVPGEYDCVAWKGRVYYTDENKKRHSTTKVFCCAIYKKGYHPSQEAFDKAECIGQIFVENCMAGFFQNKPDMDSDEEWFGFCDAINKKQYLITNEGFSTWSGYGDGMYNVYAIKNSDGKIVGLDIRFWQED